MALVELASSEELQEFLNTNSEQGCVVRSQLLPHACHLWKLLSARSSLSLYQQVTFSATWWVNVLIGNIMFFQFSRSL